MSYPLNEPSQAKRAEICGHNLRRKPYQPKTKTGLLIVAEELAERVERAERQRDALAEALRVIVHFCQPPAFKAEGRTRPPSNRMIEEARAALAELEKT